MSPPAQDMGAAGGSSEEVARHGEAAAARQDARRLLAAGITPTQARDGAAHVLLVDAAEVEGARAVLRGEVIAPRAATRPPPVVPPSVAPSTLPASPPLTEPASRTTAAETPAQPLTPGPMVLAAAVDAQGFSVVEVAGHEAEARSVAARLLEAGIGSELTPVAGTGWAVAGGPGLEQILVRVLAGDASRAEQVLGHDRPVPPLPPGILPPAADAVEGDRDEPRSYFGGRLMLTHSQRIGVFVGYVVALVVLPLVFYWGTRWILDPDVDGPEEIISQFESGTD